MRLSFTCTLAIICLFILSCSKENKPTNYLFNKLPSSSTGINFVNQLQENATHNIINYIYYYNGGGVAAGDINNDGLTDLFFVSNQGQNKLYLNKGNMSFEDISASANIASNASWNTGVTMVDINNDGYLDIYVCSVSGILDFKGHNELFINNGDNTFTEKSKDYGLDIEAYATQAYFFDYDKDNDLDVYIVNHAIHTTLSHGPANARNERAAFTGDLLLNNNGGKFTDVSKDANIFGGVNGYGLSASIGDYNNDGWDDIYVCNDFHEDDYYYINNQDGTFKETLSEAFSTISRFSMGSDAADINQDGFIDLVTLDMLPKDEKTLKETEGDDAMFNMQVHLKRLGYKDQYSRNMLQINNNGDHFTETAFINKLTSTDWSWAPLIADYNNDGHQDLFISNGILRRPNSLDFRKYVANAFKNRNLEKGQDWLYQSINEMPGGKVTNEIFSGNSKTFSNETGNWIEDAPSLSNGAIYTDLDNDGDLDLVLNNLNHEASIYENSTDNSKNYLTVSLNYVNGNAEGIGSKVIVYQGKQAHIKQLYKSRGFISSLDKRIYFGLDSIQKIDSLKVIWPNNTVKTIKEVPLNQETTISYAEEESVPFTGFESLSVKYFEKASLIDHAHVEDLYNDFSLHKLIPYKVSTLGPAVAIGDVDKNGFDDIFVGGASGDNAFLYLNNGDSFSKATIPEIAIDFMYEDNEAIFLDIDNDDDLDLYVGSGIHTQRQTNYENDRLYINDNGNFTKATNQIPDNHLNTSTLAFYDYDGDGDQDIFVGNASNPNDFGLASTSYILKNNGSGQFEKDANFSLTSKVTASAWRDVNNDGTKDLLVACEWDSPKIYLNEKGTLTLLNLPEKLNGLWQSISLYDIDNDGDQDIMIGNWGLNTKFKASKENPLRMYYSDFDNNKISETVLAYNVDGKYYPLHSKDELSGQMNIINKRFVEYKDYALKTIDQVLTSEQIKKAKLSEVHELASGYLKNDNGSFNEFVAFPQDLQLAPINTFDSFTINNKPSLLISGNSRKVNTYHGAYLSLKGYVLHDLNDIKPIHSYGAAPFNEQIKRTVSVKMASKNALFVIQNNDSIKSYTYQK